MHFLLQQLGDLLEMEMAGTFNQDQLILEFLEGRRLDKFLGGRVKLLLDLEDGSIFLLVAADTDDTIYLLTANQIGDLLI